VSIAWRTDDPPNGVADLVDIVVGAYAAP
jgi:hypothetical protein